MTNEINSNQRTFFKALNALFIESKGSKNAKRYAF